MSVKMTRKEYAEHRGVSVVMVHKYIKNGQLKKSLSMVGGKVMIDRDKANNELSQNLDRVYNPQKTHDEIPADIEEKTRVAGTSGISLADAQKLQAQYKAALMKLDYDERSGKLAKVDEISREFFDIGRRVRDAILNVPDRISAEVASMTDSHAINDRITRELVQALEELHREN